MNFFIDPSMMQSGLILNQYGDFKMAEKGKNKVNLIGRLGADPEIRYTSDQVAVANFTLATSESYKDKDDKVQDIVEWHRVVVWGPLAEKVVGKFLVKGSRIDIEGKLKTREWVKDDQKHYTTEVVVDQFNGEIIMLDSASKNSGSDEQISQEAMPEAS